MYLTCPLPGELLLAICDTDTIFILAQVNHRLYDFCLPICLGRFGIRDAEKHVKIVLKDRHALDAISVLNLAFNVKTIDRISCYFSVLGNDLNLVLRSIRRLEQLIRRLSAVKSVALFFGSGPCCCCGTPQFEESWLRNWSMRMVGLMRAILEMSAETVTLRGGYFSHLFIFKYSRRPSKTATPLEAIKLMFKRRREQKVADGTIEPLSVLKGDTWEFKRVNKSNADLALLPVPQANSKLRSLSIQSMMFLMPPLLQSTISAIQYSNLQKLTLNNLAINYKCWPALFDLIASAAPGLTELLLLKLRQIMPNDLLQFLSRLTMLTSLWLGRDVDSWDSYELGPFPDLPKLVTLCAPSIWIFKLLTAHIRGLESLEALTISYKLRNDGLTHWLQPSATPSIPALLRAQRRLLTLSVSVVLGNTPGWKMFEDLSSLVASPDRRSISSITLVVDQDFSREDMRLWTVLPRWLAMFSAVRQLSLKGTNATIKNVDAMAMMKEVVEASGLQLESLNVNGKEGMVSTAP